MKKSKEKFRAETIKDCKKYGCEKYKCDNILKYKGRLVLIAPCIYGDD